jgi:putative ABC transport system substrate-binding protein
MMDRRCFLLTSLAGVLAGPLGAEAQRGGRVAHIGYLLLPPLSEKPSAERQAFLQGLRELGYEEGRNVVIEYRSAAWNGELLPDLAADLVERKVDVILVAGPQPSMAARVATTSIPIVMIAEMDPVATGVVSSFARPGANVTGFSMQMPGLAGKRLALLREAVPQVSSVSVIWNPGNPATAVEWKDTLVS